MSNEDPDNLVLVYLPRLDSKMDGLADGLRQLTVRVGQVEQSIGLLHRGNALQAENSAIVHARLDRLSDRVERIERRLDLSAE